MINEEELNDSVRKLYERSDELDTNTSGQVLKSRSHPDEVFQRNIVGMLNRRGYNLHDSLGGSCGENSDATTTTTNSSISSTTSSISSMLIGIKEPNHGQGPLHIAVRRGDFQVVDALLANNCGDELVNLQDNNGNTALHFATGLWKRTNAMKMVERLLEVGADVSIKNYRGLTPLAVHMLTLKIDNSTIIKKLLAFGADPDTEVEGAYVLHIAVLRNLASIAGVLVAHGASMSSLNEEGLMCFEIAPSRVKRSMIRSINCAPPYLNPSQRYKCMNCNSSLHSAKDSFSSFWRRLFGMTVDSHHSNCYYCGFLYCSKCLKHSHVAEVLPSNFFRSRSDDLSNVRICPMCDAVLAEQRKRLLFRQSFGSSLRGFSSAA